MWRVTVNSGVPQARRLGKYLVLPAFSAAARTRPGKPLRLVGLVDRRDQAGSVRMAARARRTDHRLGFHHRPGGRIGDQGAQHSVVELVTALEGLVGAEDRRARE